jgi:hypothetical protein
MFQPNSGYDMGDLQIDDKNRLFENGELLTTDFKTFYKYWQEKHKTEKIKEPGNYHYFYDDLSDYWVDNYFGKDQTGNYYWRSGRTHIFVFDPQGWLIEAIEYKDRNYQTLPAVHPGGDIYFLDYDPTGVRLYRIARRWGYDESPGTIIDSGVRYRLNPTLEGAPLGTFDKGTRVTLLTRSAEPMRIGAMDDYWYKVIAPDNRVVWVYGAFVAAAGKEGR